jgi:arylsulfatase A-like enzyme/Tfp pilus assembly protein PilF
MTVGYLVPYLCYTGRGRYSGCAFLAACLGFFVFLPTIGWLHSQAAEPAPATDVFLVTIDTLRADHVGCYGDHEIATPALDALAGDGIRFTNAFTPSPITNSSHASILTGLVPAHHGVRDFGLPLATDLTTVAEVLKQHGYSTAAFIGAVILDSRGLAPGFDRGFDYYDHFPSDLPRTASRYVRLERRGMEVESRAENWILRHENTQPMFVWVHFYDPHDPYDPPQPYRSEYADRLYDGEIAYADSALARLVGFLKAQKLYDSSTIIAVGDHGEGLGEHGEQTHGLFLYDSTLHVPLIIKPPQSPEGPASGAARDRAIDPQVRTVDIAPTVFDLQGIADHEHRDGVSLRTLWTASVLKNASSGAGRADSSDRIAFGETVYPLAFGWAPLRSVREDGKKYVEAPRPEFYDLRADAHETRNIYEPWNLDVQRLRTLAAGLRTPAAAGSGTAGRIGDAKIAQLRALGYLGADPGSTTAPDPSLLPDPKDKVQVFNLIHSSMLAVEDRDTLAARHDLESALQLDSNSAAVLAQLGELELEQGNYRRAAELLGRSLVIRPRNPTAAYGQAQALYAAGDLAAARERLEAGGDLLTGNYEALCLLGRIDVEFKDWSKAEDPLEAAIILDSRRPEAYLELARVYLAEKRPADALRRLDEIPSAAPESPEIQRLKAQAQQSQIAGAKSTKPAAPTKPTAP